MPHIDVADLAQQEPYLQRLEILCQQKQNIAVQQLETGAKGCLIAFAKHIYKKNIVVLCSGADAASDMADACSSFCNEQQEILEYPAWETLPSEQIAPSPDIVGQRYAVLHTLLHQKTSSYIVVTELQAILQKVISPVALQKMCIELKKEQEIAFDALIEQLHTMGYERLPLAADKGQYALRGGIVDIFSVSHPLPVRIEFWGDEIDSIRHYDPVAQTSVQNIEHITILPAQELQLIQEQKSLASLQDYVGDKAIVILDELMLLEDRWIHLKQLQGVQTRLFDTFEAYLQNIQCSRKIFFSQEPLHRLSDTKVVDHQIHFEFMRHCFAAAEWQHGFQSIATYFSFYDELEERQLSTDLIDNALKSTPIEFQLVLSCFSEKEEHALQQKLQGMPPHVAQKATLLRSDLPQGFILPAAQWGIIAYRDIAHTKNIKRKATRQAYHAVSSDVYDLNPGDLVVHFHSGIGKFLGVQHKKDHNEIESEFFLIEYAEKSILYVPLSQAYLLSKYVGADAAAPKLHTLGSSRWSKKNSDSISL